MQLAQPDATSQISDNESLDSRVTNVENARAI
jgi:hypothetical protein